MYKIYDPVYDFMIYVFCEKSMDIKKLPKEIREFYKSKCEDEMGSPQAMVISSKNDPVLYIIYRKYPVPAHILVHEVFHACHRVFNGRGIPITPETDEAFAYYMGWLFDKVVTIMKKVEGKNV